MNKEKIEFRPLKADEIKIRIGRVNPNYGGSISLLLYKNARVDMQLLDEMVGPNNWQREHYECKGNLFCRVGINTSDGWIWKSDCGSESNVEEEKGEASDSFKRACVNWGIGRELYTAPDIIIRNGQGCTIKDGKCYDKFKVSEITYINGEIATLSISNKDGVVWTTGNTTADKNIIEDSHKETNAPPILYKSKTCEGCGAKISAKVAEFSKDKYGHEICMDCQKKGMFVVGG